MKLIAVTLGLAIAPICDAQSRLRDGASAAGTPPKLQTSTKPLSPEESLKKWHVRDGYRIELVAAEPVVLDPVAFDWDEKGQLWVVEMADYPLGMDGNGKPGGRVVMLEDSDADGRYDKRTVIADGLNFPTGILTWRDGVIVTAAPDILLVQPSGEKKLLFTGFSTGNQQLRVNGLRWGMDGWVYCAAGAHHGNYNKDTRITSVLTGEKIALGARDFRFKPDTGELDPQSGPSQFGRARDDWGHWFGVQNSFPLWHYVLQDHYLRRNPHVIPPDPIHQLFSRNPPVYPASSMEKRFHSFDQSGRFTSACGIEIYRDRVLFGDGKTHAFTCEPFHNLVQHHVLEDAGVTFKAVPVASIGNRSDLTASRIYTDFLASEDRWCRPVMVRTGPDGALWVADMYRYMIEHPQWLPQAGKDELLPHYREGDDKGRIYKVVRASARPAAANWADTQTTLGSTNGWIRDMAQMQLLWFNSMSALNEELNSIMGNNDPRTVIQAGWTLAGMGKLDQRTCLELLGNPSPRVREQALQMAEGLEWNDGDSAALRASLAKLVDDADAKIRLQLACSLGEFSGEWAADLLATLLEQAPAGSAIAGAAMSSVLPHLERVCARFPEGGEPENNGVIGSLFRCALNVRNEAAIEALIPAFASPLYLPDMLAVLDEKGLSLAKFATQVTSPAAKAGLQNARNILTQDAAAVRTAGDHVPLYELDRLSRDRDHRAEVTHLLPGLWKRLSPDRMVTLLPLISRLQPPDGPEFLLADWSERTPAVRVQIIATMLSSDAWTLALLDGIGSKRVEANACDAATRARLLKHPNRQVQTLAATVFADSASAARADVLAKFKPALALEGEPARGKLVFAQACASCHKLDGLGIDLGPDLRSVAQHEAEKLFNSILDPSAIIEPGFMAYHCSLKNGEQLYGIVATETSNSITLKLPGNIIRPILRSDIASLKSANISLMPDGLEAVLTPQSLADVIAYLQVAR